MIGGFARQRIMVERLPHSDMTPGERRRDKRWPNAEVASDTNNNQPLSVLRDAKVSKIDHLRADVVAR
jgi:hypothetical protein